MIREALLVLSFVASLAGPCEEVCFSGGAGVCTLMWDPTLGHSALISPTSLNITWFDHEFQIPHTDKECTEIVDTIVDGRVYVRSHNLSPESAQDTLTIRIHGDDGSSLLSDFTIIDYIDTLEYSGEGEGGRNLRGLDMDHEL